MNIFLCALLCCIPPLRLKSCLATGDAIMYISTSRLIMMEVYLWLSLCEWKNISNGLDDWNKLNIIFIRFSYKYIEIDAHFTHKWPLKKCLDRYQIGIRFTAAAVRTTQKYQIVFFFSLTNTLHRNYIQCSLFDWSVFSHLPFWVIYHK